MNVTKLMFSIITIFLVVSSLKAQTSINIYPINGAIGVKFLADKKISLEPRLDFQFDRSSGESNIFVNAEFFTTVNFLRENKFNMYSGIGLGANIYNQAQTNFCGTLPLGASYYFNENKRVAIIGECGFKITAYDFIKVKSYALIGLQIRLTKTIQQ